MPAPYRIKLPVLGGNIPNKVTLTSSCTIGAAGAITAITPSASLTTTIAADGSAVQGYLHTVTHTAAGTYVFAPAEQYVKPSYYNAGLRITTAAGAASTLQVRVRPYDTSANTLTVQIVDTAAANAATDPPSGSVLQFFVEFVGSTSPAV